MTRQLTGHGYVFGYRGRIAKARGREAATTQAQPRAERQTQRPRPCLDTLYRLAAAAGMAWAAGLPLMWLRRLQSRHELARLNAAQLRDVGLDPEIIRREAAKPFWQE